MLALWLLWSPDQMVQAAGQAESSRPRIGLVLSGGGARGAAHIGVLKVLEELRIPIDVLVGTSMGSLVGGGYVAGLSPSTLAERVTSADWDALFDDDPPRRDWPVRRQDKSFEPTWDFTVGIRDGRLKLPKGIIAGQQVQLFLSDLTQGVERIHDFDALPIPFRAVATDLESGGMAVFDRGPLAVALRASMSVPTVFSPMEWDDHLYVDGGLVRNLPIDVARGLGAEVIIAVNLGSGYLPRDQLDDLFGVFNQMIAILTEQNVQTSLRELEPERDLLIVPELGDINSTDFKRAAEAIAAGETAARQAASRLARYSLDETAYAAWREGRFGRPVQPPRQVGEVRIDGLTGGWMSTGLFSGLTEAQLERPLERDALVGDIQRLYGRGDFERLSYHLESLDPDSDRLVVDALEKNQGPGYLRFGLSLSQDNRGDNRFGLRGTYERDWVNRLGAEWWTELTIGNAPGLSTELYQPLTLDRHAFIAPHLSLDLTPVSIFFEDQRVARYDVSRGRLGVDLGATLGGTEVRLGPYLGLSRVTLDTGTPELPEGGLRDSGIRGRILHDRLDSPGAPSSGTRIALTVLNPLHALGADLQYSRIALDAEAALSRGANIFQLKLKGGAGLGDLMPYFDQFTLGGFLNLSGYANEQIRGNDKLFGALIYSRRIASLTPPLGRGLYLGASLEGGWLSDGIIQDPVSGERVTLSTSSFHSGGSLFFGSDTWIGPAYLALGLTGTGESTFYLMIGKP
ncbi:MAG: patatin [Sphingobacteriia bacterium]|nr:patatin [Sphingobacteriia bacterium]NCC40704.1 patatin [Gammaproteobacteria bacterium]